MALEAKLTAVIKTVCTRTYPDFAPNGAARPFATYQQIGGNVINPLDRVVPEKENAEIQVQVWADTRLQAKELMKQVEAAIILSTDFIAKPRAAAASDFDADVPIYSSRQDFTIWCDRA